MPWQKAQCAFHLFPPFHCFPIFYGTLPSTYIISRHTIFVKGLLARCLERRLPGSGLERGPGCHPERSEGSLRPSSQTLRFAQGDRHSLQISDLAAFLDSLFQNEVYSLLEGERDKLYGTTESISAGSGA